MKRPTDLGQDKNKTIVVKEKDDDNNDDEEAKKMSIA